MGLRIPQAPSFVKLRTLLEAIGAEVTDLSALGRRLGAGERHAGRHGRYYREMAEVLGMVDMPRCVLTARGKGLLATRARSEEERVLLRRAVADAEELGPMREALLADAEVEPDVDGLVAQVVDATGWSESTARTRVNRTLRWRERLAAPAEPEVRPRVLGGGLERGQLGLFAPPITLDPAEFPLPSRVPFNWPADRVSVRGVTWNDLQRSDEVLLVMGYTSLRLLCGFVARASRSLPRRIRVVFGTEPYPGREGPEPIGRSVSQEMRDYWLEEGISILHALDVQRTLEALREGRLRARAASGALRQHAKMFVGDEAITVGSSNFTMPGLEEQLEANVRLGAGRATRRHFDDARKLAEVYWKLAEPFEGLEALLEALLKKVTWEEALARGCAELLEGEWAQRHLRDELGYGERLWPSQVQGIGQALYVLMEVGSVLIADATGSGKTRTGAWLLRALRERLVSMGRPIADPVLVSPPAVVETWAEELHSAEVRVEAYSHGTLSSSQAGAHGRVRADVESARILALDEAHNFIQASNRTQAVRTNLADHVVLFTATPINRDVSDLLGIADLLGADNLDDETVRVLEEVGWRARRELEDDEKVLLRRALRRFTVRRTKRHFNALIDQAPHRYQNANGQSCRYPEHAPRYYALGESEEDRRVAGEISAIARELRGVLYLRKPMKLTRRLVQRGWTPERYVKLRLRSGRALARYQVRRALRSSRAALWEHLHGTAGAKRRFGLERLEKSDSGEVLARLEKAREQGPPKRSDALEPELPAWLRDAEAFDEACAEELARYRRIAELCEALSAGREEAKAAKLRALLREHEQVVAFDSRPITLEVLRQALEKTVEAEVWVASGGRRRDQRRVQEHFRLGAARRRALALCSDSMSEGINLQQASAIVHLDMPSVVRIAEQRVGRIDRMDSSHGQVESWWPKDAEEFALAADEKLDERLELVDSLLGSNLELPDARVVTPEELQKELEENEERQLELLDDAFAAVRGFVEGDEALVREWVYSQLRGSRARVVSAVALVRAETPWGFFTLPGSERAAPRWVFVDGAEESVTCALDEVSERLRARLAGAEDAALDERARETMEGLLAILRDRRRDLLPRRKQRLLEEMERTLEAYENAARRGRHEERRGRVARLLELARSDRVDLDPLAEAWLGAIRSRWRAALAEARGRSRRRLFRVAGLRARLREDPLSDEELEAVLGQVRVARPLGERVVAAIVGVPGGSWGPAEAGESRGEE